MCILILNVLECKCVQKILVKRDFYVYNRAVKKYISKCYIII